MLADQPDHSNLSVRQCNLKGVMSCFSNRLELSILLLGSCCMLLLIAAGNMLADQANCFNNSIGKVHC